MAKFEDLRAFALELPLAYEDLHFNGPAFRVRNRKFALLWMPTNQTIMKLPQHQQQTNFEERPAVFQPIRVGTVFWSQVALTGLRKTELKALTISAWTTVAPKRVVKEFLAGEYETPPNPWLPQH
jgi:hypothetical protein